MNYVIVDIETTGLDIQYASIIEVAAILIKDGKLKDRFSSLVQYKDEIPETIKRITGIKEDMVVGAPPLTEVLEKLKVFIDKYPVVAHNGFGFDFPMLERHGVKFTEKYDSLEFAFFVMPVYPHGHSMSTLSDYFQMPEVKHRALSDCEGEFEVIGKLQSEFTKRPKKKREGLIYAAQKVDWWWAQFLKGTPTPFEHASSLIDKFTPYRKKDPNQDELSVGTKPIDINEVEKYFIPIGNKSEDYSEDRPDQKKMARLVAKAFNESKHAVIEAGTGTGKSKAYLVPSLLFGLQNSFPVIISTYTKALQDQLFFKEIPHIKATINPDLQVALLKGKKNYVCVNNFEHFEEEIRKESVQRSLYEFKEEGAHFTNRLSYLLLLSWIITTERGDWDEVPYWFKEKMAKRIETDICNFDELCGSGTCDLYDEEICFLARARMRARDADLVIINHALTLSGIFINETKDEGEKEKKEGSKKERVYSHAIFPNEAKFIVFDEAHHLEETATGAWEYRVSFNQLNLLIQQLFGKGGAKYKIEMLGKQSGKLQDFV